ncbi:MAG: Ribose ABC transport system, permease protein RbsC, partial [uncultured Rubellimicrobium sp.]
DRATPRPRPAPVHAALGRGKPCRHLGRAGVAGGLWGVALWRGSGRVPVGLQRGLVPALQFDVRADLRGHVPCHHDGGDRPVGGRGGGPVVGRGRAAERAGPDRGAARRGRRGAGGGRAERGADRGHAAAALHGDAGHHAGEPGPRARAVGQQRGERGLDLGLHQARHEQRGPAGLGARCVGGRGRGLAALDHRGDAARRDPGLVPSGKDVAGPHDPRGGRQCRGRASDGAADDAGAGLRVPLLGGARGACGGVPRLAQRGAALGGDGLGACGHRGGGRGGHAADRGHGVDPGHGRRGAPVRPRVQLPQLRERQGLDLAVGLLAVGHPRRLPPRRDPSPGAARPPADQGL